MKQCPNCGRTGLQSLMLGLCVDCFQREFLSGFNDADDEIRNANPHIYGNSSNMWGRSKPYTASDVLDDIDRAMGKEPRSRSRKPPWPKPIIKWEYTFDRKTGGWKVQDQVTEGWIFVPLEAVEARLGHPIAESLASKVTYTQEILECARRLLILLVYGCPPKIGPGEPPPKPKIDFNKFMYEDIAYMKYHKFTW